MIELKQNDLDEIIAYGKNHLPNEACGLLAGESGENVRIKKIYYLTNLDESNEHFSMDPKEQLAAVRDMRANGLVPLGNFHSHPETPARMSEEDKRLAFDKKAIYMILSLMDETPVLKAFKFQNDKWIERNIVII